METHQILLKIVLGFSLMTALMSLVWLIHLPIKNAGIVDVAWGFGMTCLGCLYFFLSPSHSIPALIHVLLLSAWGIRLTYHLFVRIVLEHSKEDARYEKLRTSWAPQVPFKFFLFFNAQGILNLFLAIPFFLSSQSSTSALSPLQIVAVALFLCSWLGESLSDYQLKQFKKNPLHLGKVCNVGLWKYSRHPNYFFEWMIWVSFALYSLALPFGFLGLIAPLLILFLLLKVTGVPASEEQSLKSRGQAYVEYQKKTSVFFPWFPKQI